jgi:hypothetical protein
MVSSPVSGDTGHTTKVNCKNTPVQKQNTKGTDLQPYKLHVEKWDCICMGTRSVISRCGCSRELSWAESDRLSNSKKAVMPKQLACFATNWVILWHAPVGKVEHDLLCTAGTSSKGDLSDRNAACDHDAVRVASPHVSNRFVARALRSPPSGARCWRAAAACGCTDLRLLISPRHTKDTAERVHLRALMAASQHCSGSQQFRVRSRWTL